MWITSGVDFFFFLLFHSQPLSNCRLALTSFTNERDPQSGLKTTQKDRLWPQWKGRAASYRISWSLSIFVGLWITRLLYLVFSWSTSESFPHNWLVTVLLSFWAPSFNLGLSSPALDTKACWERGGCWRGREGMVWDERVGRKIDQRIRCQSPGRIGKRREPVEPGDRRLISLMDRYLAFLFSFLRRELRGKGQEGKNKFMEKM